MVDTAEIIRDEAEAMRRLDGEASVALDLETSGFSPWRDRIHVVTLAGEESGAIAVLHYPQGVPVSPALLDWLSGRRQIVAHNGAQFDILFLAQAGMVWDRPQLYDTMLGEQATMIADRKDLKVNLAWLVEKRLGRRIDKSINHGRWGAPELDEQQLTYCAADIRYLFALRDLQRRKAMREGDGGALLYPGMWEGVELEMELARCVIRMQLNGLTIDRGAVQAYLAELEASDRDLEPRLRQRLAVAREEIDGYVAQREPRLLEIFEAVAPDKVAARVAALDGAEIDTFTASALARIRHSGAVSLTSSHQLLAALDIRYGEGVFPDTNKARLQEYAAVGGEVGELCADLLRWRQIAKRESMFSPEWFLEHAVPFDGVEKIHGHFWQLRTNTGRFSSSDPNLQQVPKDMRHCFGNRPGWAVGRSDYASIELRVAAAIARDEAMLRAFAEGEDIHRVVAAAGLGKRPEDITPAERKIGKAMSFTMTFGGSAEKLYTYARANGSALSLDEAQELMRGLHERFTGLARLHVWARERVARSSNTVLIFPTGLRRQLVGDEHRHTVLLNNLVQATAAAGMKYAMLECERLGLSRYLVATVHDELVYEAPEGEIEEVRQEIDRAMLAGMRRALEGRAPVALGVESSWGPTWHEEEATARTTEERSAAVVAAA